MPVERNYNFDLLRLMGLMIIMIAHSSPPGWIFQLRNFGTPLLVIGSALTYSYIFRDKPLVIKRFIKKRVSRLILPLWLFLTFFFTFFLVMSPFFEDFPFTSYEVITSYFLFDGIGFVWVFKIYLFLAFVTPLAIKLNRQVEKNSTYLIILLIVYFMYELLVVFLREIAGDAQSILINKFLFIIIPYSLLFFYGYRLEKISNKAVFYFSLFSLFIFIYLLISKYIELGEFVPTQDFKYPPTLYYFSYAFFCINTIYLIFVRHLNAGFYISKWVVWLSSNSLWIYLWHIAAFYIWEFGLPDADGHVYLFLYKVAFLLLFSVMMVFIQNIIIKILLNVSPDKKRVISLFF
ncbi:acyltransferase family protein [uncultured Pseudoalteromonas sp.]|uniref:acyltransferase family protein n=1 Tax=uncultured Pseudoalteromonas sp. TaxID=114053 RepID=UPI002592F4C1|nr:acyltransferase family protein [uncultured Pseudoalteromonas sp.]